MSLPDTDLCIWQVPSLSCCCNVRTETLVQLIRIRICIRTVIVLKVTSAILDLQLQRSEVHHNLPSHIQEAFLVQYVDGRTMEEVTSRRPAQSSWPIPSCTNSSVPDSRSRYTFSDENRDVGASSGCETCRSITVYNVLRSMRGTFGTIV